MSCDGTRIEARGVTARGSRRWTQTSLAVGLPSHAFDRFGQRVAVGDLNGDGYADLVVGAPTEAVHGLIAGAVVVGYGSARGDSRVGARLITEDTPAVPGIAEDPDQFGFGLSIGDLNGDGISDLVVGAPGARSGSVTQTGAIVVLPGSPAGLTTIGGWRLSQDSPGTPGVSTMCDGFSLTTATGDFAPSRADPGHIAARGAR